MKLTWCLSNLTQIFWAISRAYSQLTCPTKFVSNSSISIWPHLHFSSSLQAKLQRARTARLSFERPVHRRLGRRRPSPTLAHLLQVPSERGQWNEDAGLSQSEGGNRKWFVSLFHQNFLFFKLPKRKYAASKKCFRTIKLISLLEAIRIQNLASFKVPNFFGPKMGQSRATGFIHSRFIQRIHSFRVIEFQSAPSLLESVYLMPG